MKSGMFLNWFAVDTSGLYLEMIHEYKDKHTVSQVFHPFLDVIVNTIDKSIDQLSLQEGDTPMHFAARWGSIGIVKYLMDNGADLNVINMVGNIHYELHNTINGLLDIGSSKHIDQQLLGAM